MPFIVSDPKKEAEELQQLLESSKEARKAVEEFDKAYDFRMQLIQARKAEKITQKQLGKITGLSQQAISRIETGAYSSTVDTLLKYLGGIGYRIALEKLPEK